MNRAKALFDLKDVENKGSIDRDDWLAVSRKVQQEGPLLNFKAGEEIRAHSWH